MAQSMSRRDFLRLTAASLAALSLPVWLPPRATQAQSRLFTEGATSFDMLASSLTTGADIIDISTGWDGTQWAVDEVGIPHQFDPLQNVWIPFGQGVDGAVIDGTQLYLFHGGEVALYDTSTKALTVQTLADRWPQLPPTFTNAIDGASLIFGSIYLFRSGRYVNVDKPTEIATISSIIGWPTDTWPEGVTYKVGTFLAGPDLGSLFPTADGQELLLIAMNQESQPQVWEGPLPLSDMPYASQLTDAASSNGFNTFISFQATSADTWAMLFQGPAVWTVGTNRPLTTTSLGSYVPDWFPPLMHAPRGRVGNLWSVRTDGVAVQHDGGDWNIIGAPANMKFLSIDVGVDDAVFGLAIPTGGGNVTLYTYDATTGTWQTSAALNDTAPRQVSVGDATRVYVLDSGGAVSRLQAGSLVAVSELGSGITQIAANHDGTVWHTDSTTNAYRFISERPYPPSQIPAENGTTVVKIASTSYGNALMLVEQNGQQGIYSYGTPYVFKTSPSYVPAPDGQVSLHPQMAAGGGRCYVNVGAEIAALDSHTGAEDWITPIPGGGAFASMIYDPHLQLLYVTDGQSRLISLDAATGALQWFFETACTPISAPMLSGTGLCVVGANQVFWIDTQAALASGRANPDTAVKPVWSQVISVPQENTDSCQSSYFLWEIPIIDANTVYVLANSGFGDTNIFSLSTQTGEVLSTKFGIFFDADEYVLRLARLKYAGNQQRAMALDIGAYIQTLVMSPSGQFIDSQAHAAPSNVNFSQGMAFYDGRLYIGGSDGNLYALDSADSGATFTTLTQSPVTTGGFSAGPVVIPDGQGSAIIAFAGQPVGSSNTNAIFAYDLTTGNVAQIDTDYLLAKQLTVDTNGILYVGGQDPRDPNKLFGQIWAIRIAEAIQQERDFIVESALMQDFDEPVGGSLNAVARYQTHVTIVDAQKAPRPYQPVKIWADDSVTVLIDGTSYSIDATTHATMQTDAAGTLTIVTDATDLSTAALKLWAGFMNPHERIMVYPDRELHQRLTTTTYQSTSNPAPMQVNLATAAPYDMSNLANPAPLFSASEAPQATAVAGAIQKLTTSVNYQGGASVATRAGTPAEAVPSSSYLAYDDLVAAAYSPVSTPASQLAAPATAGGFSFDGATFAALSPADAADAIDALEGTPSDGLPGSIFSWFRKLWDDIKRGVAKVEKIVISIGRDIYIGLKYAADGVAKVFRQAIRDIEDAAIAIGSMLVQLGKDIVDAVEALSVIFHLGQVVATAGAIKGIFNLMLTNLPEQLGKVQSGIDNVFANIDTKIASAFSTIEQELAPQAGTAAGGIGGLQGMGATPHTIFTVGPNGSDQKSSHAVPAMWDIHKVRHHYPQASGTGGEAAGAADSELTTFLENFVTGLLTGSNSSTYSQFKTSFQTNVQITSAKEFFASALANLLSAVETVVEDMLAVIQELIDGVLNYASDVAALVQNAGNADIPILSSLWKLLTGNELTWLDLITFVIAIPVAMIYRVVEGSWPDLQVTAAGVTSSTQISQRIEGIATAVTALTGGIFAAILDTLVIASPWIGEEVSPLLTILNVIQGLGVAFGLVLGDVLETNSWVIFASVFQLVLLLLNEIPTFPPEVPSSLGFCFAPALLYLYVEEYENTAPRDALGLSANVIATVALLVNPIKFAPPTTPAPLVAPIADIACGLAVTSLTLADTIKGWDTLETPTDIPDQTPPQPPGDRRIYFPTVRG